MTENKGSGTANKTCADQLMLDALSATLRVPPKAAKPPLPVHCTSLTVVPTGRAKSPEFAVRPTTPLPLMVSPLVPPETPMPPGRAVAWSSLSTPPPAVVVPE